MGGWYWFGSRAEPYQYHKQTAQRACKTYGYTVAILFYKSPIALRNPIAPSILAKVFQDILAKADVVYVVTITGISIFLLQFFALASLTQVQDMHACDLEAC